MPKFVKFVALCIFNISAYQGFRRCRPRQWAKIGILIAIITITLTFLRVYRSLLQLLSRPEKQYMKYVRQAKNGDLSDSLIHKHKFAYLLNNESTCKDARNMFLLIYVLSARGNELTRRAIRETWGSIREHQGANVRVVFLTGQNDDGFESLLKRENEKYGDIIQGNFLDTYENLTYKSVMGLHWVKKYCSSTRFVLKTDDDVVVNIYKLIHFLRETEGESKTSNFLYCRIEGKGTGVLPIRDKHHKFYVNMTDYKYDLYPPYCHGLGSVFSIDVATKLLEATTDVPFFKFEDVFMGFCARVAEVNPVDSFFGFYVDIDDEPANKPFYWPLVNYVIKKPFRWAILKHLHGKPWKIKSKEFELSPVQNGIIYYRVLWTLIVVVVFSICFLVILFVTYFVPWCYKHLLYNLLLCKPSK